MGLAFARRAACALNARTKRRAKHKTKLGR
jgi:hypothetical protein